MRRRATDAGSTTEVPHGLGAGAAFSGGGSGGGGGGSCLEVPKDDWRLGQQALSPPSTVVA